MPNLVHALVLLNELLLHLHDEILNRLLDLTGELVLIHLHVGQQLVDLLIANLAGKERLHRPRVHLLQQRVSEAIQLALVLSQRLLYVLDGTTFHAHHARHAAAVRALKTRAAPRSTRERSLLQLVHLVSAIEALAFIAGCIAQVSLRLNSIGGSFILNLLDELAKLFHAADVIKLFKLALDVSQPQVLLREAVILLLQVLLEARKLVHKAALQVLLRFIDFINHGYRSHTSDFLIDQLDVRLRLHVLIFGEKLGSFDAILACF